MSVPVDFEGSNFTYLGPTGEDCLDLPVFKHADGVIFCTRFTPEELQQIAESGCVWVQMKTHRVPMVLLSAAPLVTLTDPDGTVRPSKPEPFIPKARVGGLVGTSTKDYL